MKISSLFVFCFLSIRSDKLGALSDPPDSIHLTAGSKYQDIKNNNNLYEVKISSLQRNIHNSDLVDEQIRNVLGYGKNNEFIIFFDN